MEKYGTIIVGAGPAGIFTAYELGTKGYTKSILMIEQGKNIDDRRCPKSYTGKCMNCSMCSITAGFSGAGAFSDGKLSLSSEVGGDFPELVGYNVVTDLIKYVDNIYVNFGASQYIEGLDFLSENVNNIRRKAIEANLKLVNCPIRHMGTEEAHNVYYRLEKWLQEHNVQFKFNTKVNSLSMRDGICTGVVDENGILYEAENVVIATGRRGAEWLFKQCEEFDIEHQPGTVDIGVRVECRNEIMQQINESLYEAKLIGYPLPFKNKVRTFCQNPGGFVSQERYDEGLSTVNGHSYKNTKSNNTNFSILCSHNFTQPFDDPIEYAKMVGKLTNMLATDNSILVQRFGDIIQGKRTWQKELNKGNVKPSLTDAVAGDITSAIPYRTMTNIIQFILQLDKVVPGIASNETLLYAPELKFYSNKIKMDSELNTNIKNLYCLGDSSGWTRGLMMASAMGVYMGRKLLENK